MPFRWNYGGPAWAASYDSASTGSFSLQLVGAHGPVDVEATGTVSSLRVRGLDSLTRATAVDA